MTTQSFTRLLILLGLLVALTGDRIFAGSSVKATARYSWGANIGWIDWRADLTHGADFVAPPVASGYIYSANIGWIYLGSGRPVGGRKYSNTTADDCGVNIDYLTDKNYCLLSGYAWSANAGWINFNVAAPNQPRINKLTGELSGYAYGANLGWLPLISLPQSHVLTGFIYNGAQDWERYR